MSTTLTLPEVATLATLSGAAAVGGYSLFLSKGGNASHSSLIASLCAGSFALGGCFAKFAFDRATSKPSVSGCKKSRTYGKQTVEDMVAEASKKDGDVPLMTKEGFIGQFEAIKTELVEMMDTYEATDQAKDHMARMLDYNVVGGKLNRGLTVVHTAAIIKGRELTADEAKMASVLGWSIEWMQASFLVTDDIMDSSITRRGHDCWYRVPDIGMAAINDGLILLTHIDVMVRAHFGKYEEYLQLHDLLTETAVQTELGQLLDLTTQPVVGPVDLKLYTMDRYLKIVKYKTAFYSFYAPIALGMIFSGICDAKSLKQACDICVKMGTYFQIQDDVLDAYAPPEVLGKIGTDIQDKKCSWLVVQALDCASPGQRLRLESNLGQDDEVAIANVKAVYKELELEEKYLAYETAVYKELIADIKQVKGVPQEVFLRLLHKIYKRQK